MLKEGVRLDRVRGGRQKYRRSTDPYTPVKTAPLEGDFFIILVDINIMFRSQSYQYRTRTAPHLANTIKSLILFFLANIATAASNEIISKLSGPFSLFIRVRYFDSLVDFFILIWNHFTCKHKYSMCECLNGKFSNLLVDNKMLEALAACEPDMLQVSNISHTLDTDQRVLGQLSDLYDRELVGIIGNNIMSIFLLV